jgi:hypothetical protein
MPVKAEAARAKAMIEVFMLFSWNK